MIKNITVKQLFRRAPHAKRQLWGSEFWSDGYFISTVGHHGNESVIMRYIQNQGKEKECKRLHRQKLVL